MLQKTYSISKNQIRNALDGAGLKNTDRGKYILTQCPFHEDSSPSAQVFIDEGFVHCHAGCERQHITKAFPALKGDENFLPPPPRKAKPQPQPSKSFNLYDKWMAMEQIPREHKFKNLPLQILDGLGWKWDKGSYFIPYWSEDQNSIPFAQWRHLEGERRFTFLKDAKPILYGLWNLEPKTTCFIVEGTSDAATLEHCALPWVAMPSASSKLVLKELCSYAEKNDVKLIYAGDNDEAGDSLMTEITCAFRQKRPRNVKDWSDMFQAEGMEAVQDYCMEEL